MSIRHILCPIDFSDASTKALALAAAVARAYGARLTALHVRPTVVPHPDIPIGGPMAPWLVTELDALRQRAADACRDVAGTGVEFDATATAGEPVHDILDRAAAGGITFLDTADVYPAGGGLETVGRTEEIVGRWLEGRRQDFVVATKCVGAMSARPWDRGASRKHVLDAIDGSLRRLRTDYVDLYQLHHFDPQTPIGRRTRLQIRADGTHHRSRLQRPDVRPHDPDHGSVSSRALRYIAPASRGRFFLS